MVKIVLKWGKEKYDLELEPTENILDCQVKIYALTNVPVDKQKLIYKGNVLKVFLVYIYYHYIKKLMFRKKAIWNH